MESRSYFAIVGVFVILGFAAMLGFFIWLSGGDPNQEYDRYVVSFEGPVRGIQEAAEVRFQGIKVGEVKQIRLDPDDTNKVLVYIEVVEETPVDIQSYAQLEPMGLTGLSFVQLTAGDGDQPLLKDQPGRGPYYIEGRGSQLDSLLAGGGSIVESVQKTLNQAQALLSDDAINDVERFLESAANIAATYEADPITATRIYSSLDVIDQAAKDVSAASISVDATAAYALGLMRDDVKPLIARAHTTLDKVDRLLDSVTTASDNASALIVNADGVVTRLEATTLQDLRLVVTQILELSETLNRVAIELERDPAQFISGEDREYVKVPQ